MKLSNSTLYKMILPSLKKMWFDSYIRRRTRVSEIQLGVPPTKKPKSKKWPPNPDNLNVKWWEK